MANNNGSMFPSIAGGVVSGAASAGLNYAFNRALADEEQKNYERNVKMVVLFTLVIRVLLIIVFLRIILQVMVVLFTLKMVVLVMLILIFLLSRIMSLVFQMI